LLNLTGEQAEFIEDLKRFYLERRYLSEKQKSALFKFYFNIRKAQGWDGDYDNEEEENNEENWGD
jgi:hypothetical protein